MDGLAELARRVAQLDAEPGNFQGGSSADIAHFITVMEQVTSDGTVRDVRTLPVVSPADADALVGGSRLLARLMDAVPEIVAGPLCVGSQYWVGTGKPSFVPKGESTLQESHFISASDAAHIEVSTKPFGVGLFTSTGVLGTYGMWRMYLDLNRGSTLHPLPWYTWAVEPHAHAVVHEIASASQWVEFVVSHPRQERGLLFPDWRSAAQHRDAIHMTLRAVAATQGLYFPTRQGIVAAPHWDMESTLWLRWRFHSVRLVEMVT